MISEQELHNLAMRTVGDSLRENDFEFLTVNSKLNKDPQFVCLKEKKLHFFIVRAFKYPDNPKSYDTHIINKLKDHAENFGAQTYYAGVGFANSKNYEEPINKNEPYVINFEGWTQIE